MKFLVEGRIIDLAMLSSFIKRLVTPFDKTKAFKLGIIDKDGNVLKTRKTLKTSEERNAYTEYDTLVFNLKKLLGRIPAGKTLLGSVAAATLLLKEETNVTFLKLCEEDEQYLIQEFFNIFEETTGDLPTLQDDPYKKKNTVVVDRMPSKLGKSKFKIYKSL